MMNIKFYKITGILFLLGFSVISLASSTYQGKLVFISVDQQYMLVLLDMGGIRPVKRKFYFNRDSLAVSYKKLTISPSELIEGMRIRFHLQSGRVDKMIITDTNGVPLDEPD